MTLHSASIANIFIFASINHVTGTCRSSEAPIGSLLSRNYGSSDIKFSDHFPSFSTSIGEVPHVDDVGSKPIELCALLATDLTMESLLDAPACVSPAQT
jgi:hypothetical protein